MIQQRVALPRVCGVRLAFTHEPGIHSHGAVLERPLKNGTGRRYLRNPLEPSEQLFDGLVTLCASRVSRVIDADHVERQHVLWLEAKVERHQSRKALDTEAGGGEQGE